MQTSHHRSAKHAITAASKSEAARSEEVIASSGVTFRLWRLYQHAWLVCLVFPLVELFRESPFHGGFGWNCSLLWVLPPAIPG